MGIRDHGLDLVKSVGGMGGGGGGPCCLVGGGAQGSMIFSLSIFFFN